MICGGGQTALQSAMRGAISVNDEHATTIRIEIECLDQNGSEKNACEQ